MTLCFCTGSYSAAGRRLLFMRKLLSNMKFAISEPKIIRLPRNERQTYRLNSRHQMQSLGLTLAMTLTLDSQGQTLKEPYLRNRRDSWHWTKGVFDDHGCELLVTKVRIYPGIYLIMTSDVGVPLTHLVLVMITELTSTHAQKVRNSHQDHYQL